MNIQTIHPHAWRCQIHDTHYLGLPIGVTGRGFASADTVAIRQSNGILVSPDGTRENWGIEKFAEHDAQMLALGPWIGTLHPFESQEFNAQALRTLLHALQYLKEQNWPLGGLYVPSFQWCDDGRLFVLPPLLGAWVRDHAPDHANHKDWDLWNHPDLRGEEAWSFSLACLVWQVLTQTDPFQDERGEERRERIRQGVLPSLPSLQPRVSHHTEEFLLSILGKEKKNIPQLGDWEQLAKHWQENNLLDSLTEEEAEKRRIAAQDKVGHQEKILQSGRWLRKSGWKIILALSILGVTGLFAWGPITNALRPPITQGMAPFEVAQTFYEAIDRLNSQVMDDCLARHVGEDDQRHVDMIYVTHKVRQGYERIGELPRAEDWLAAGKPELPEGVWPWGIVNLSLTEQPDGSIEALYELWGPVEPVEGQSEPPAPRGVQRRDVLRFKQGRQSWEISEILREQ